jgi:predicted AAA+ superfamily ATPase
LSWSEIPDFDLMKYVSRGGLPGIYQSESPEEELSAYLSLYLREEIIQEAATRDVPGFARFLDVMGQISGEELVIEAIASDAGVKASTVRNYLDILRDTLLTFEVQPFLEATKRKAVSRSKIFAFDVGVANLLAKRAIGPEGSDAFGKAFEHFIMREVQTYLSYTRSRKSLCYWRTTDQKEVDLIIPDWIACEIKAAQRVTERHLKSLLALKDEGKLPRYAVICQEPETRVMNGIEILPWQNFLKELWSGISISVAQ